VDVLGVDGGHHEGADLGPDILVEGRFIPRRLGRPSESGRHGEGVDHQLEEGGVTPDGVHGGRTAGGGAAGFFAALHAKEAAPEAFAEMITQLLNDSARREKMAVTARKIAPSTAASNVADVLEKAVGGTTK
jgi:hypothetical protein